MTQGEYIKKYRKEKGMTQAELALACNTAEGTIYQYEQGKRTPKTEILFRIADVLGVTAYDLQDDRFRNPDNSVSTFYSALQESDKKEAAIEALPMLINYVFGSCYLKKRDDGYCYFVHDEERSQDFDLSYLDMDNIIEDLKDIVRIVVDKNRFMSQTHSINPGS